MAQKTDGALDPTIYPVLTAWGFTTDHRQVPSQEQIAELQQNVGYERIQLDGTNLTVPDGMQLDLGAVGKGYTADLVVEQLKENGIESALISLGGISKPLVPGRMEAIGRSASVPLGKMGT